MLLRKDALGAAGIGAILATVGCVCAPHALPYTLRGPAMADGVGCMVSGRMGPSWLCTLASEFTSELPNLANLLRTRPCALKKKLVTSGTKLIPVSVRSAIQEQWQPWIYSCVGVMPCRPRPTKLDSVFPCRIASEQ